LTPEGEDGEIGDVTTVEGQIDDLLGVTAIELSVFSM